MGSEARIVDLLVEKYGVQQDRIAPDASMADLGLDSLSVVEMIFDIEDIFEIELSGGDSDFASFAEAVALVDRHLEAKGG